MQKYLQHIYNSLLTIESFFLLFFLLAAILLASSQILLRNFFDSGIFWADSALRILVLWIGMIGAMYASRNRNHIRIDVLTNYLPIKLQYIICHVTDLITAIICGIAAFYSIEFVQYEYEEGLIAFANIPVWLCASIIPVAFAVMALRYLVYSLMIKSHEH